MKLIILLMATLSVIANDHNNFNNNNLINTPVQESSIKGPISNQHLDDMRTLNNNIPIQSKIQLPENVKLNTFTQLPKDVEGCACYFYLSKSDEDKGKYIMTEIYAQTAYISINGKMQEFDLVNFKDKVFFVYSNGNYTLRVEFKNKIKSESENFSVNGVLMIFKAKKMLIKRNIIGGCSC